MILGEICYFYANHSGIIKKNLSLLRNFVKERERLRKKSAKLVWSPLLTTLIMAISGPLLLLHLELLIHLVSIIAWLTI